MSWHPVGMLFVSGACLAFKHRLHASLLAGDAEFATALLTRQSACYLILALTCMHNAVVPVQGNTMAGLHVLPSLSCSFPIQ